MGRTLLALAALVLAGCGGAAGTHPPRPAGAQPTLSAEGIGIDLPDGWTGRIVIGDSGRPVLHASTLPVEPNDTDEGEIAREQLGVNGMYLNVRDRGPGTADASLPLHFDAGNFGSTSFNGAQEREAAVEVASDGERFRVTVVSGGDDAPKPGYLAQLNDALASLQLAAYTPQPVSAATGNAVDGYGLHANVPSGWDGGVARAEVHAGDASLDVGIQEYRADDSVSFETGRVPILLGPAEFVHPEGGPGYETGRTFTEAGRWFQLWVRAPARPDGSELERANAFLASFHADPGDFYPGQVDPATFEAADGWDTGNTGPAQIQPDGQQTMSWASTVSYRDTGFQFPPSQTLAALPPDGIVLTVQLVQAGSEGGPPVHSPFRLTDFREGSFEGLGPANDPRSFGGHYGNYEITIWALFGREHPTEEQLARAQAELDRLQLPTWPAWTLTSAER